MKKQIHFRKILVEKLSKLTFLFVLFSSFSFFGQQASLTVTKTIDQNTTTCNTFDVSVDVDGVGSLRPQEVILVIDRSGSMSDGGNPKPIYYAKLAAKDFVDKIFLPANNPTGLNRVAIVSYSASASIDQHLTSNKQSVINAINDISTGGNTNIEDAMIKARNELDNRGTFNCDTSRSIILLTDGVANVDNHGHGCSETSYNTPCQSNAISAGQNAWVINKSGTGYNQSVFTIGLTGAISGIRQDIALSTLNQIQNSGAYSTESNADLSGIYSQIFGQLNFAAKQLMGQPFLTSSIVPGFSIVPGSITTNKGTTSLNGAGDVLSWNVPQVATESIYLRYQIVADNATVCGEQNPEDTVIKYENSNCTPVTQTIPSPDICVPCPTVTADISRQNCSNVIDYTGTITEGACGGMPTSEVTWEFFLNNVSVGTASQLSGTFEYTGSSVFTGTFKAVMTFTGSYGNGCTLPGINADDTITLLTAPNAPVSLGNITECKENPTQTLNAKDAINPISGQSIIWYTALTGGSVVSNPILDSVGSITYYAEAQNPGGCSSSTRTPVKLTINPLPLVDAGNYQSLCVDSDIITLTGTPTNSGGTWTGSGVTDNGNGTASFDPSGLNGAITVTYSYTDGNTCSNSDTAVITVNEAPIVDAGTYEAICNNSDSITLTGTPTNSGGTWTGSGITDNGNGTATFDPSGLNGSVTLTYSYTDGKSCSNSDSANIIVNTAPDAPTDGNNQVECATDPIQTLTAIANVPVGQSIVWYDQAVGGNEVSPILNTIGSVTYYAEAVNNSSYCLSSSRTPVTLTLNNCSIQIEKIASPNNANGCTPLSVGESIDYTFKVKNPSGNSPINNVELRDLLIDSTNNPLPGPDSGDTSNPGVLDAGETWIYTASYNVTQQNITDGQVQNIAFVNGLVQNTSNSFPVSNSDTVIVSICQITSMSVIKSQTGPAGSLGDIITYDIVVKNTGNTTLSNIEVTDANAVITGGNPIVSLLPNATATVTAQHEITQADLDLGYVENIALGTGDSINGTDDVTDISDTGTDTGGIIIPDPESIETPNGDGTTNNDPTDDPTVTKLEQIPGIALIKKSTVAVDPATGCSAIAADTEIGYTFSVKNTGNVTLANVMVSDLVAGVTVIGGPISLEPGEEDTTTFTATYTVTQADVDAGIFTNTASVVGTPPSGPNATDTSDDESYIGDDPTVINICSTPAIAIVKAGTFNDGDGDGCSDVDETIDYTFTVTNQGNVSLSNVTVTDPLIASITGPTGDTDGDGKLDITETWTYTASYAITQDDIDTGSVTNQATAAGNAPDASTISDLSGSTTTTDDQTITDLCQNPAIAIVKTGVFNDENGDACSNVDETITYTFTVTNERNVSLGNVTVTDPLIAAITGPTGDTDNDGILDVTETWVYTGAYAITQGDIDAGEVLNQATATGIAPDQSTVTDLSGSTTTTDGETITDLCQNPAIAIVKTGVFNDENGDACSNVDETITYTFTVTNEGNVSLGNVTVTDPLVATITGPTGDTNNDGILDVTETWVYTGTYAITQGDIDAGEVLNQATATGIAPDQSTVTDLSGSTTTTDGETITDLCQNPAIAIVKTGVFNDENGDACSNVDETITYTFTVTNEGNVSLGNVTVTDPLVATITGPTGDTNNDGILDVTETWVYTGTYAITQSDIDAGSVTNQATAEGTAPDQSTVTDLSGSTTTTDDQTITDLCQNPAIAIVKTGVFNDENGDACSNVDETITYTFTVTNEGNVSLGNVTVTDPLIASITGPTGDTDGDGKLDITETWIYTASYAITQDDIDAGSVTNQATAAGNAPDASTISDLSGSTTTTDDQTITDLCQNPAIAIVKTGVFNDENGDACSNVDETITYTFTVTNEGNVSLGNVTVTDPLVATITGPTGDTNNDGILDVTETWVYTGTYAITQGDIDAGEVLNQATATGIAPDQSTVTDLSGSTTTTDDQTITDLCQNPAIAIVKTGVFNDENGDACSNVDETITYTFTVTNEGNVSLGNVTVTDPLVATITGPTGDTNNDGILDVTETWVYTGTYAITQGDIDAGSVTNQATAEGTAPDQSTVTDLSGSTTTTDDQTITDLCQNPAIAIVKTGVFNDENGDACSNVDETITYTFTVTNEGNASLGNVTVTDPLIATITGPTGDTNNDGILDVTETWVYTGAYAITQDDIDTGSVTNQATATGIAPDQSTVTDLSDESSVIENDPTIVTLCQNSVIALIKTGVVNDSNGNGCADVGEAINYSFTVFNLGNVTLTDVSITDPLVTVIGGPITLAPGVTDNTSFTATYNITQDDIDAGQVVNQATVVGNDPSGSTVNDLSDDNSELENDPTITLICQNPAIALIKTGVPVDENGDGCANLGETIAYTFSVKNVGNISLTDIIVTDPLVTVIGGPIDLTAGETDVTSFTAVYTVTQADVDAGFVENQATVEGIEPNGDTVSDLSDNNSYVENDATVTVLCQNPSISLEKTGEFNDENGDGASDVGETISYAFAVTNTGNVTLYNITITDPLPGIEINGGPILVLQPGERDDTTFTATYVITQEDIDNLEVVNQAIVTGEDSSGNTVTDHSDDPTDLTNIDDNGDGDPDDPTVVVLPAVLPATFEIFNGITPNGDNYNDYFWIQGIHNYPNNNVKIYNRWGVLVFETDSYGQGPEDSENTFRGISDGRVTVEKNKELPTGTYYYILTFPSDNPGKSSYSGYLYINR